MEDVSGDGAEEEHKPVTLFETLRLIGTSRQMQCAIPIIFYNGMRCVCTRLHPRTSVGDGASACVRLPSPARVNCSVRGCARGCSWGVTLVTRCVCVRAFAVAPGCLVCCASACFGVPLPSLGFFFGDFPTFYADTTSTVGGKTIYRLLPNKDVGFVVATFYLVNSLGAWQKNGAHVVPARAGVHSDALTPVHSCKHAQAQPCKGTRGLLARPPPPPGACDRLGLCQGTPKPPPPPRPFVVVAVQRP
jgi:hypothetical protein